MTERKDRGKTIEATVEENVQKKKPVITKNRRVSALTLPSVISVAIVLIAIVSADYWRPHTNMVLGGIFGTPRQQVHPDHLEALQTDLKALRAQQQALKNNYATLENQTAHNQLNIDELQSASDKIQSASDNQQTTLSGIERNLDEIYANLLEHEQLVETFSGQNNALPEDILKTLQGSLARINLGFEELRQQSQRLTDAQGTINQEFDELHYGITLGWGIEHLINTVQSGKGFAPQLAALRTKLRETDRQQLASALAALDAHATNGTAPLANWQQQAVSLITAEQNIALLAESPPTSDGNILQQVWHEIRGLVKISKIEKTSISDTSPDALLAQLADLAQQSGNERALTLKQQGEQIQQINNTLHSLSGWLKTQQEKS